MEYAAWHLSPRFILYIDILGFSATVQKMRTNNPDENGELIYDMVRVTNQLSFLHLLWNSYADESKKKSTDAFDGQSVHFSDTIVISFAATSADAFRLLVTSAMTITEFLYKLGMTCRGAMHYGNLFHENNFLYGPALVDAYFHESKCAIYPRIILTEDLSNFVREAYPEDNHLEKGISHGGDFYFVDYISKYRDFFYTDDEYDLSKFEPCCYEIGRMKYLGKCIEKGLKNNNPSVRQKYHWLEKYYTEEMEKFFNEVSKVNHGGLHLIRNYYKPLAER